MKDKFIKATQCYNTFGAPVPAYYFRRTFISDGTAARLTVAVCGFYELYFNGKRITRGFVGCLDSVAAYHMAPAGKISVSWKRTGNALYLDVVLPQTVHATAVLPAGFCLQMQAVQKRSPQAATGSLPAGMPNKQNSAV